MANTKTHLGKARGGLYKMRRRLVLIAEGKCTRSGLENVLKLNIEGAHRHIQEAPEEVRSALLEEWAWLKEKLEAIDPLSLPETKP